MAQAQPLTDLAVRSLKPPATGQYTFRDPTIPGFGVRISQGGTKTFTLMHGPDRKLTTLGHFPIISLAQARKKARDLLAARQLGIYQQVPKTTFAEAYDIFLKGYKAKNRPKTVYDMERLVRRHLMAKFKNHRVAQVMTHELAVVFDGLLQTPAECKAAFAAARTIFRWLAKRGLIDRNPMVNMDVPVKLKPRKRVLTDDELRIVWETCRAQNNLNPQFASIVKLLVLTGQREGQIAKLRGEWIDRDAETITWPAEAMKSGRVHILPLAPMALAMVGVSPKEDFAFRARGRDTPFNGFSTCKQAFDERADIAHWTLHDLRRTFSTGLARLRVLPHIKERILAHSTAKDPVEAIYDLHTYEPEMREALEKWERHLAALLERE